MLGRHAGTTGMQRNDTAPAANGFQRTAMWSCSASELLPSALLLCVAWLTGADLSTKERRRDAGHAPAAGMGGTVEAGPAADADADADAGADAAALAEAQPSAALAAAALAAPALLGPSAGAVQQ